MSKSGLDTNGDFGEDHRFFQAGWSSGNPKFIEPLFLAAKGNAEDDNAEDDYDKDDDADDIDEIHDIKKDSLLKFVKPTNRGKSYEYTPTKRGTPTNRGIPRLVLGENL
ncbi:hypothetical protein DPMN_185533 [Dreissena polymorpha]|uniref:Uncharacterized protein n=1 Tax=Dreissena polymorpha TaxID=45954 RepID=A0A9D4DJV8_DREPO|nr:hypothetical protein DPMN_185533 [Dreissena polymorpha]